mgnify:CR=1 FL=1
MSGGGAKKKYLIDKIIIIKKQCSNKTEVEKIKSIIKFIKVISSRIDYE